jgi:hypothetical protein
LPQTESICRTSRASDGGFWLIADNPHHAV